MNLDFSLPQIAQSDTSINLFLCSKLTKNFMGLVLSLTRKAYIRNISTSIYAVSPHLALQQVKELFLTCAAPIIWRVFVTSIIYEDLILLLSCFIGKSRWLKKSLCAMNLNHIRIGYNIVNWKVNLRQCAFHFLKGSTRYLIHYE